VWSGLLQMSLDLVCIALSGSIGIEEELNKAVLAATAADLLLGILFVGESGSP